MARTRTVRINESLEELEQLRQVFRNKPEARRLLFLSFLKENKKCTVSEAAVKAGISERRGRYWWDAYRTGGLQNLISRRVWKVEEGNEKTGEGHERTTSGSSDTEEGVLGEGRIIAFMNSCAMASLVIETPEWISIIKDSLVALLEEIDYVVININQSIDVYNYKNLSPKSNIVREQVDTQGSSHSTMATTEESSDFKHTYEAVIQDGQRAKFPFHKYNFPPHGIDLFIEPTKREYTSRDEHDTYIGSLLFLKKVSPQPISQSTIDVIERIRPFLIMLFIGFIVRKQVSKPFAESLNSLTKQISSDGKLSKKEQRVLAQILRGYTYQEVADLLHVSLNTIQSHLQATYRKLGVKKLSEVYAKYLTHRLYFSRDEDEET